MAEKRKIKELTYLSYFDIHLFNRFKEGREEEIEMRWFLLAALMVLVVSSSLLAEDLKKISLDDASSLGTRIETDTKVKVEGKGSIKITTAWPTVVCLGEVQGLNIENAKLVYRAKVKADLKGTAYLEMWCHFEGKGEFFSRSLNSPLSGTTNWVSLEVPFFLKAGENPDNVKLNVVGEGTGTIWVDDIRLVRRPL